MDRSKNYEHPIGFCICEPLFTYTEKLQCIEYEKGEPCTEEEWEAYNEQA